MSIRLETSTRNGITNHQDGEISYFELNWTRRLVKQYPNAIRRSEPSVKYNCHGLTFASRRTRIDVAKEIQVILTDDRYHEIQLDDVKAGDVVVYYSETGDANHSGMIVAYKEHNTRLLVPMLCSKWGFSGEFIHALNDCPPIYGPITKFYRCTL